MQYLFQWEQMLWRKFYHGTSIKYIMCLPNVIKIDLPLNSYKELYTINDKDIENNYTLKILEIDKYTIIV